MTMATAKKTIMREFKLHEISAVTMPAQKGAQAVIMKRRDDEAGEPPVKAGEPRDLSKLSDEELRADIAKGRLRLTSDDQGHSHLIDLDDYAMAQGGGMTRSNGDESTYHTHPYVIGKDGTITIGMARGHTHMVMAIPTSKAADDPAHDATSETLATEGDVMTPEQIAKMEETYAIATMTDPQKSHLAKLSGDARAAFIAADFGKREEIVKATVAKAAADAADANPVVYTSKSGDVFRKSDDERLIGMAKRLDAEREANEVAKQARIKADAVAMAKTWTHSAETMEQKVAKAEALLSLPEDSPARKAALEAIDIAKSSMAGLFKNLGEGGAAAASDDTDPGDAITKLAKDYAGKANVDFYKAYDHVITNTAEGQQLYEASLSSRH
jgi:hypothetical protein